MPSNQAEHGKAVASLVLGIVACVTCFFGVWAIVGVVLGIIGLVFSRKATSVGNTEGINKAGFVLSLIGLCLSGIVFVVTFFFIGSLAAAGMLL